MKEARNIMDKQEKIIRDTLSVFNKRTTGIIKLKSYKIVEAEYGKELLNGIAWEEFCLEMSNNYAFFIQNNLGSSGIDQWNMIAQNIHESSSLVKIQKVFEAWRLSKGSIDQIAYDVLHLVIYKFFEEEYHFYFQFYEEMYQIYLSGHLPVGYEGDYPNGTFYVMNPQSEE